MTMLFDALTFLYKFPFAYLLSKTDMHKIFFETERSTRRKGKHPWHRRKTNNPNPSPTGKTRFGLYWFGAGDRTRLHYGVGVVQPPPKDSPPGCPISVGSSPPRYQESRYPVGVSAFLVPVTGLEPVRHRWRWILSPLRLPFHHTGICPH